MNNTKNYIVNYDIRTDITKATQQINTLIKSVEGASAPLKGISTAIKDIAGASAQLKGNTKIEFTLTSNLAEFRKGFTDSLASIESAAIQSAAKIGEAFSKAFAGNSVAQKAASEKSAIQTAIAAKQKSIDRLKKEIDEITSYKGKSAKDKEGNIIESRSSLAKRKKEAIAQRKLFEKDIANLKAEAEKIGKTAVVNTAQKPKAELKTNTGQFSQKWLQETFGKNKSVTLKLNVNANDALSTFMLLSERLSELQAKSKLMLAVGVDAESFAAIETKLAGLTAKANEARAAIGAPMIIGGEEKAATKATKKGEKPKKGTTAKTSGLAEKLKAQLTELQAIANAQQISVNAVFNGEQLVEKSKEAISSIQKNVEIQAVLNDKALKEKIDAIKELTSLNFVAKLDTASTSKIKEQIKELADKCAQSIRLKTLVDSKGSISQLREVIKTLKESAGAVSLNAVVSNKGLKSQLRTIAKELKESTEAVVLSVKPVIDKSTLPKELETVINELKAAATIQAKILVTKESLAAVKEKLKALGIDVAVKITPIVDKKAFKNINSRLTKIAQKVRDTQTAASNALLQTATDDVVKKADKIVGKTTTEEKGKKAGKGSLKTALTPIENLKEQLKAMQALADKHPVVIKLTIEHGSLLKRLEDTLAKIQTSLSKTPLIAPAAAKEEKTSGTKSTQGVLVNEGGTSTQRGVRGVMPMPMGGTKQLPFYDRFKRFAYPLTGNTSFGAKTPMAVDMAKGMGVMFAIGGAMSAVSNSFNQALEYQNIMETAKAILRNSYEGGDFSGDFESMAKNARDIGVKTKFSAPEVAGAAKFLAMAGLDINMINSAIKPISDVALSGDLDLSETADKMTNILTAFEMHKNPASVERFSDMMVNTFTRHNVDMLQLAESSQYAAPVAHGLGMKPEEMLAILGVMGDAGIQASMAGTSLRMIIQNILKPSKPQKKMWTSLGIERFDSEGNPRNLIDILSDVANKVPEDKLIKPIMEMFRVTSSAGALQVIRNLKDIKEQVESNKNADGIAAQISLEKQGTMKGLWAQVTSTFTEGIVQAVEGNQSRFTDLLKDLKEKLASPKAVENLNAILDLVTNLVKMFMYFANIWIKFYNTCPGLIQSWIKLQMVLTQIGTLITPFVMIASALSRAWILLKGVSGLFGVGSKVAPAIAAAGAVSGTNMVGNAAMTTAASVASRSRSPYLQAAYSHTNGLVPLQYTVSKGMYRHSYYPGVGAVPESYKWIRPIKGYDKLWKGSTYLYPKYGKRIPFFSHSPKNLMYYEQKADGSIVAHNAAEMRYRNEVRHVPVLAQPFKIYANNPQSVLYGRSATNPQFSNKYEQLAQKWNKIRLHQWNLITRYKQDEDVDHTDDIKKSQAIAEKAGKKVNVYARAARDAQRMNAANLAMIAPINQATAERHKALGVSKEAAERYKRIYGRGGSHRLWSNVKNSYLVRNAKVMAGFKGGVSGAWTALRGAVSMSGLGMILTQLSGLFAMLVNPITIAVAAVGGLALGIYSWNKKINEEVRNFKLKVEKDKGVRNTAEADSAAGESTNNTIKARQKLGAYNFSLGFIKDTFDFNKIGKRQSEFSKKYHVTQDAKLNDLSGTSTLFTTSNFGGKKYNVWRGAAEEYISKMSPLMYGKKMSPADVRLSSKGISWTAEQAALSAVYGLGTDSQYAKDIISPFKKRLEEWKNITDKTESENVWKKIQDDIITKASSLNKNNANLFHLQGRYTPEQIGGMKYSEIVNSFEFNDAVYKNLLGLTDENNPIYGYYHKIRKLKQSTDLGIGEWMKLVGDVAGGITYQLPGLDGKMKDVTQKFEDGKLSWSDFEANINMFSLDVKNRFAAFGEILVKSYMRFKQIAEDAGKPMQSWEDFVNSQVGVEQWEIDTADDDKLKEWWSTAETAYKGNRNFKEWIDKTYGGMANAKEKMFSGYLWWKHRPTKEFIEKARAANIISQGYYEGVEGAKKEKKPAIKNSPTAQTGNSALSPQWGGMGAITAQNGSGMAVRTSFGQINQAGYAPIFSVPVNNGNTPKIEIGNLVSIGNLGGANNMSGEQLASIIEEKVCAALQEIIGQYPNQSNGYTAVAM